MAARSPVFVSSPPDVEVFSAERGDGSKFVYVAASPPLGLADSSDSEPVDGSIEVQVRACEAGRFAEWRSVAVDAEDGGLDLAVPAVVESVEVRGRLLSKSGPDKGSAVSAWSAVESCSFAPERELASGGGIPEKLESFPSCPVPALDASGVEDRGRKKVRASWTSEGSSDAGACELELVTFQSPAGGAGRVSAASARFSFDSSHRRADLSVPLQCEAAEVRVRALSGSEGGSSEWSAPVRVSWQPEWELAGGGESDAARDHVEQLSDNGEITPVRGASEFPGGAVADGSPSRGDLSR